MTFEELFQLDKGNYPSIQQLTFYPGEELEKLLSR